MKSIAGYTFEKKLGQGGAGVVWKATQDGEPFAIKVLHRGGDATQRDRFELEGELLLELEHPNLVRAIEYGVEDDQQYLVLEYVEGTPIAPIEGASPELATQHGDALVRLIRQFEQAALALDYLHQNGIVHRDVKPENILIDNFGNARLVDLGVARVVSAETMTLDGELLGTAYYLSPEQAMGSGRSQVDARSDLYSLGVALYYCLTGRHPFTGENYAEILQAIILGKYPTPQELVPSLARDLHNIVMKCLERDPRLRFSSARELADELRRFRSHQAVRTRGINPLRHGFRFLRTRAAILLLLALLGIGVWELWLGRQLVRREWVEFQVVVENANLSSIEVTPHHLNWRPTPGFTREALSKSGKLRGPGARWYRFSDLETGRFATILLLESTKPQRVPVFLNVARAGPRGFRPFPASTGLDVRMDLVRVGEIRGLLKLATQVGGLSEQKTWERLQKLPDDALVENVSTLAAGLIAASLGCRLMSYDECVELWTGVSGESWAESSTRKRLRDLMAAHPIYAFHVSDEQNANGALFPEAESPGRTWKGSVTGRTLRFWNEQEKWVSHMAHPSVRIDGVLLLVREHQ